MLENFLAAPGWSFQRVVRIGIASYFVSVVLGLVEGPTVAFLFGPFVTKMAAHLIGNAVLAGLSIFILMGWYRSAATVVLALLLFVASYLQLSAHFLGGGPEQAEAVPMFWRDFAIIVLLLLTYTDAEDEFDEPERASRKVSILAAKPVPTQVVAAGPIKPLSRGSVQQAFHVSPTGRAVSRQLTGEEKRRRVNDTIEAD